ncbi:MAG: MMPL family transporter [Actinomycetota bacterium]|nr:MMPL family transporter [Actinomycetota bacterium]
MFFFLGRLAFARRWYVLAGTIVFLAAAVLTGLSVFDKLGSGGFEDPNAESTRATAILADRFDAGSPDLVLLVTSPDGDVDASGAVRDGTDLTDALIEDPGVGKVVSYWGPQSDGGGDPGLRSTDGDKALVLVRLSGDEKQADTASTRLQDTYAGSAGDLDVQIGGPGVGLGETIGGDLARAEAIAIPITLVLLLLVFGGVVAALLPLAVGAMAIMGTFLALFVIASATDVSIFSINLATALGLGLAIDYSLLVVSRFREEFAKDSDTQAAVGRTMQTAGRTVAFSAITVAVSLSALLIFPLYFLRSFAYAGISVVAIAAGAALLTLPALLAVLGPKVNRFAVGRKAKGGKEKTAETGFWYSLSHTVMRRPILTGLPVVVLLVALALPFLGVSFSLPDDRALPTDSTARIVGDSLRNDFDDTGARSFPVVLPDATDDQTTELAVLISAMSQVNQVETSTGTFANGAQTAEPGPPAQGYADEIGSYLTVFSDVEPVSPEGEELVDQIRATDADVPFLVTGPAAALVDSKSAIFGLVPLALAIVAGATFVLLFLMTGSVLVPIKAIVLNVLSLGATFGAMVWVFQDGNGADLLNFTPTGTLDTSIPVLMFCIAFGLSMDYEVFLLSRIKEEHDRTGDTRAAVAVGLQKTGRIMTAAAGVLAVTFLAFSTSSVTFIKLMGLGLTLAILMDATLVRGVLVPAFMRLAGEANWWAPPFLRQLHNRFGLSEGPSEPNPDIAPLPERVSA